LARAVYSELYLCCQAHWEFQHPDGSFESYPPDINAIIEKAFQAKTPSAGWTEDDDEQFVVDFSQNLEIAKTSGQQTPVKRICDGLAYYKLCYIYCGLIPAVNCSLPQNQMLNVSHRNFFTTGIEVDKPTSYIIVR